MPKSRVFHIISNFDVWLLRIADSAPVSLCNTYLKVSLGAKGRQIRQEGAGVLGSQNGRPRHGLQCLPSCPVSVEGGEGGVIAVISSMRPSLAIARTVSCDSQTIGKSSVLETENT